MNHYRNISDMPFILVGTQGSTKQINVFFIIFFVFLKMQLVKVIHVLYMKIVRENYQMNLNDVLITKHAQRMV
jgi:hypothetical protein